ncbi:HNH endonuclease [Alteromonas sp. ASW11-36]|uniref:HNH endonuclease n=1 Tax=Alteromonas arenosi TaxID=3055817 RepID=A0ABT7T186_9ALTE|nr:HNH endonuclease [Alteromonas sp. ASW11-36]MDM7862207.1 HNH endonuclease [Alteromonas sp. ASW11-36]
MAEHTEQSRKRGQCPLCKRMTRLTFHHLIPRKMHRRKFFQKHYDKQQLQNGIAICQLCHTGIHRTYDEMYLAKHRNSLVSLQADEQLQNHFQWVAKQRVKPPLLT